MKFELTTQSIHNYEYIVALLLKNLLLLYREKIINFDQMRSLLVNSSILNKISQYKCNEDLICAIDLSLELDCIEEHFSDLLNKSIYEIINMLDIVLMSINLDGDILTR